MGVDRVHLIGIGGIGMSGLARMYREMGWEVQGTDLARNEILDALEASGVRVFVGHDASRLEGANLVIYSSSIPSDHVEREAAVRKGIRLLHRAEALAELSAGRETIAIAGTHGKTTTTSLAGMVLEEGGQDPTVVVGGWVPQFGGNVRLGRGRPFVLEADESDSSFHRYAPALAVITNIENEHMDHFKKAEQVDEAYRAFLRRLPEEAVWIGCADDPRVRLLAAENIRPALLYGLERSEKGLWASHLEECPSGRRGVRFSVWEGDARLGSVEIRLLGRHNVLNALAAVGIGLRRQIPFETIARGLGRFEGTRRRFDIQMENSRCVIADDYAHHPTEIRRTLEAARALRRARTFVLFQPHRFSRTQALMEDFAVCFRDADKVFITDIYAAGEKPRVGVTGETLAEKIRNAGHADSRYVSRAEIARAASREIREGDLVLTLGAGDIRRAALELRDLLSSDRPAADPGPFAAVRGKVIPQESLARHTTLRVGGPAQFWIEPEDPDDLARVLRICRERSLEIHLFGSGSNILAPDEGLRGVALHLGSAYFRRLWTREGRLGARAGVPNTLFIQYAAEGGFGGYEFLLGIPGCLGGSVAMNAGSHEQSLDRYLERVRVMDWNGAEKTLEKRHIPFAYRSSGLEKTVILEAEFLFPAADRRAVLARLEEYRQHRARTQDLRHPSAGCMFKNPKQAGCSSGRLLEEAGLKGRRIGNAQISSIHANFIVNLGGARAEDVLRLIREARQTVYDKFQIELEPEVKILEPVPCATH